MYVCLFVCERVRAFLCELACAQVCACVRQWGDGGTRVCMGACACVCLRARGAGVGGGGGGRIHLENKL